MPQLQGLNDSMSNDGWEVFLNEMYQGTKFQMHQNMKKLFKQAAKTAPICHAIHELPADSDVLKDQRPDVYNDLFNPSGKLGQCPWNIDRVEQMTKSVPMRKSNISARKSQSTALAVPAKNAAGAKMKDLMHQMGMVLRCMNVDRHRKEPTMDILSQPPPRHKA